jgi:hypothetical protein
MPILPDPYETYFFRNLYNPESIHTARKAVAKRYPNQPIVTIIDGDFRGKDAFSLRCVDVEAALKENIPGKDVLDIVTQWSPIKRRDMHADDIQSGTIQYNPEGDNLFLDTLITGEKNKDSLSIKGAKRAKHQLEKNGAPVNGRVQLSNKMAQSLGSCETVDISEPIPKEKKNKKPSVHVTQNIWHYLDSKQKEQLAQNLQDTQAEGSYLVVGANEADNLIQQMPELPGLLQRHGYVPEKKVNEDIKSRKLDNSVLLKEDPFLRMTGAEPYVYLKQGR